MGGSHSHLWECLSSAHRPHSPQDRVYVIPYDVPAQGPREDTGFTSDTNPGISMVERIYNLCHQAFPKTKVMVSGIRKPEGARPPDLTRCGRGSPPGSWAGAFPRGSGTGPTELDMRYSAHFHLRAVSASRKCPQPLLLVSQWHHHALLAARA
jgi:hypothetical protein